MSWSLQRTVEPGAHVEDGLTEDERAAVLRQNQEGIEQVEMALVAANLLLRSGVCGDHQATRFQVTLSGHANPGHTPRERWANDCITIGIVQL